MRPSPRRALAAALALAAAGRVAAAAEGPTFSDQTAAAGIDVVNTFGGLEKRFILEAHGTGAAFFDADDDGWLDLYVVNGATFDTYRDRSGPGNTLYRGAGGRFADVTARAGVAHGGWGAGCAVGDVDGDGDRDLYVTNYGPNALYANLGEGRFAELTEGPAAVPGALPLRGDDYSASAAFFDADNDGDLDLYVTNYVVFERQRLPDEATQDKLCVFFGGVRVYCGPKGMEGAPDRLYRNEGSGGQVVFADVTGPSGVAAANRYYGLGVVPEDYDRDGDTDLFIANDETPNVLFRNEGDGTFTDVAKWIGVAYNENGEEEACMGADFGDYDNDGDADLYVTNFFRESNTLYRNEGGLAFTDVTAVTGLAAPTLSFLAWGTRFFDYDHDGDLDLFVANGHVYPQVDSVDAGSSYRQRNQLFRNDGPRFTEIFDAGAGMGVQKSSRGAAFGDYDNDGDLDIFVANLNDRPTLLRNDGGNRAGHWLLVQLRGRRANRDGLGARLRLQAGGAVQWRTVNGAASYLSHNDVRAHFGLGGALRVERLDVTWPGGGAQTAADLPVDRLLVVDEAGRWEVRPPGGGAD